MHQYFEDKFLSSREFMLKACKINGYALYFASEEIRQDEELVMEALKQNGFVLKYSNELYKARMDCGYFHLHLPSF